MVPRSAEAGYLVTKVVAVDADSGHNAWLSYHLLQATEPTLFSMGLHTGEIRTARAFADRDAVKHRLVTLVKDNGQPPLSATVTLNLVFAENFQEALPEMSDQSGDSTPQSDLQFYLVLALALISFLFLLTVALAIVMKCGRSMNPPVLRCFGSDYSKEGPGLPPSYCDGTLPYNYNQRSAADSGIMAFSLLKSNDQNFIEENILCRDNSGLLPMSSKSAPGDPKSEADTLHEQAQPNPDWRFSQAQRPGTSGSQNGEEGGAWPNNQFDTEMLQAMILASANEAADGNSTLGGGAGTMGLSTRYGPQFTLQHVPDYRQNVYIPGSTATLSNSSGKRDGKSSGSSGGNKKKSGKKEKK
ncbi:protocadherin gamma-B5-like isoform X27 [Chelonoidis abingdonii]|uniref:protocadherin gamma-B5-like isoform X27 n=1 Tax=Chelonoidis abingdonii TaxID=106734 RepID=UPI003F49B010